MVKSFSVLTTAPLSFAMTSFGVPFGAHIACQGEMCRPGAPASSTVGISGAGRQRHDQVAMNPHRRAPGRDQAAIRSACEGCNGALDLAGAAYVDRVDLHAE